MASVRQISRRIRSVQNTAKITKAMAMIAASKLRRSQDAATQGRYYANSMKEMVSNVISQIGDEIATQPLAQNRESKNIGILFITPDRGLTGGLNSNLMRALDSFMTNQSSPSKIIGVGKKGIDYSRRNNMELLGQFSGIGDKPKSEETVQIANLLIEEFKAGSVDSFFVGYSQFVTTTLQKPIITQLLPIQTDQINTSSKEYIYEPTPEKLLSSLLPRYIQTLVHHSILEANAS